MGGIRFFFGGGPFEAGGGLEPCDALRASFGQVGHTFTFVTSGDMARFETMLRESADCWDRISRGPRGRRRGMAGELGEGSTKWVLVSLLQLKEGDLSQIRGD